MLLYSRAYNPNDFKSINNLKYQLTLYTWKYLSVNKSVNNYIDISHEIDLKFKIANEIGITSYIGISNIPYFIGTHREDKDTIICFIRVTL